MENSKKLNLKRILEKEDDDLFSSDMKIKDLLDEDDQIILSDELFEAFKNEASNKKYFNERGLYKSLNYLVEIYNDDLDSYSKYSALEYFERICKVLDYTDIRSLASLSLEQLNRLLDCSEDEKNFLRVFNNILRSRKEIKRENFDEFKFWQEENHNFMTKKSSLKVFNYLKELYNENTILQDNVNAKLFLEKFSKYSKEKVFQMRMFEILDIFGIKANFEKVSENQKLIIASELN